MLAALGVRASELPIEVYDNGVRAAYVVLFLEGGGRRRLEAGRGTCSPNSISSVRWRAARVGDELEGADVLARWTEWGKTPRPGLPQARSRVTSAVMASCPGVKRSRSSRAPRSAGPRRCTRGRPAPAGRSSRSRWAAPRSPSPAASSSFRRPGHGLDVGQLGRERAPEAGTVGQRYSRLRPA